MKLVTEWLWPEKFSQVKFVFPSAPAIPMTMVRALICLSCYLTGLTVLHKNHGMPVPAWFDIVGSYNMRIACTDDY